MSETGEVGRVSFTIGADASEFTSKIVDAKKEVDKFTTVIHNKLETVNKDFGKTTHEVLQLRAEVARLTQANEILHGALQKIVTDLTKMQADLKKTGRDGVESFSNIDRAVARVRQEMLRLVQAYVGFQTVRGAFRAIQDFEDLEDRLRRVTGSAASAETALNQIRELFRGHGVDIRDAAKAYTDLVQSGIQPTAERMMALANIAETVGSDVGEVAKAVRAATQKQFDQLRELGFRVQAVGNNLRITFQGVTTTVRNSAAGITQALERIGGEQLRGASAEADGLGAAFARLQAAGDNLAAAFGEGLGNSFSVLINKISELGPYIEPLANAIGVILSGAFKTASAAIDLFIAGLDGILAGIRALITLANSGSFSQAMDTLSQGMAQARADFERRQANPAGTATPHGTLPPITVTATRTAVDRRRGGGGGGRGDQNLRELQQYVTKLQQEAAAAETNVYEAERSRMMRLIETMKAAGGAMARQATELEAKIAAAAERRNTALSNEAIRDLQRENEAIRVQIKLGENAAEVYRQLNSLRERGVALTPEVIASIEAEVATRRRLSEELKEQTQRSAEIASGLSNAFGNAFQAIIEPGAKLSDILKQLEKDLMNLATRVLVLQPLEKMLNSILNGPSGGSGSAGGGGILGLLGSALGSLGGGGGAEIAGVGVAKAATAVPMVFHGGGEVGAGGTPRLDLAANWNHAPRFHAGLAASEFRAILQRGEVVLNKRQQQAVTAASSGDGATTVNFYGVTDMESFRRSEGQINSRLLSRVGRGQRVA